MSEWIDCTLDVLATNPKEINDIANALREPSRDLLVRFTTTWPPDEAEMGDLREFVGFKPISNLGHLAESVNKARRYQNSFKNHSEGPIYMHLCLVSAAFPDAIFLAHYSNIGWGYSWKEVMSSGRCRIAINRHKQLSGCCPTYLRRSGPNTKTGSHSEACGTNGSTIWSLLRTS